LLAKLIS